MPKIGTQAKCPNCKKKHDVVYGKDEKGEKTKVIGENNESKLTSFCESLLKV